MKPPSLPTTSLTQVTTAPESPKAQNAAQKPAPVAWQAFLEDDADCCGGCNHKPR